MSTQRAKKPRVSKSRTRRREKTFVDFIKFHTVVGQPPDPSSYVSYHLPQDLELMDENSLGKDFVNRLLHYKHQVKYHLHSPSGVSVPNGGANVIYVNELWVTPPYVFGRPLLSASSIPYRTYSLKDFARDVLNIEDTNLLDFIRTIKQIPELITKFSLRLDKLHLAIQYGFKPLFEDLVAIRNAMADGQAEWERMKALEGKTIHVHLGPYSSKYRTKYVIPGAFSRHELSIVGRVKQRASCIATVGKLPDQPFGNILHQLDRLGLGRWASTAWEAIPFSFAIDWFVKVGDVLKEFDTILQSPSMVFYHFSRSISFDGYFKVVTVGDDMFTPPRMIGDVQAEGPLSLYMREPFLASAPVSFSFGTGLDSADHQKNLLALISSSQFK